MNNPQAPSSVVVLEDADKIDWDKTKNVDMNKLISDIPATTRVMMSSPPVANRAQTVRVVYNPHNLDSCLALTIIAERVKQNHSGSKIIPVSIDYASHDSVVGEADILVICGVSFDDHAFLHEVNICKPSKIVRFTYLDQTVFEAVPPDDVEYIKIDPTNIGDIGHNPKIEDVQEHAEQVIAENSISALVNEYFFHHLKFGTAATDAQRRLMGIVSRYINFGKFDGIWETDQETEKVRLRENNDLAFLYRNQRGIRRAAELGECHAIPVGGVDDPRDFKDEINRIRKIILRNMQDVTYEGKTKYLAANTVCVGEDDSFEVMRQLNHSFSVAITYEDIRNQRVYRILCKEAPTLALLKDVLKPVRSWLDCRITYFSCELPKFNQKVQ